MTAFRIAPEVRAYSGSIVLVTILNSEMESSLGTNVLVFRDRSLVSVPSIRIILNCDSPPFVANMAFPPKRSEAPTTPGWKLLQLLPVAAYQGQRHDLRSFDDGAELRRGGINLDGVGLHGDLLAHGTEGQLDREDVHLIEFEVDFGDREGFEANLIGGDVVVADGELEEIEAAIAGGGDLLDAATAIRLAVTVTSGTPAPVLRSHHCATNACI